MYILYYIYIYIYRMYPMNLSIYICLYIIHNMYMILSLNMQIWGYFMVFRCLTWRGRLLVSLYRLLLSVTVFNVVFGPRCVGGSMLCESWTLACCPLGSWRLWGPCMWTLEPSCAILATRTLFEIISAVRDRW